MNDIATSLALSEDFYPPPEFIERRVVWQLRNTLIVAGAIPGTIVVEEWERRWQEPDDEHEGGWMWLRTATGTSARSN